MIPGVATFHPRSAWEPQGYRMAVDFDRTPSKANWSNADLGAIHYTSAINLPDGDPSEILNGVDGIRQLLARTQIDYYQNRTDGGYTRTSDGRFFPGYPTGYSFAVDWLGGVWELRGWDYLPAATSGHNGHTIAILMLTDRNDPAPPLMLRSARMILRETNRRGGKLVNRPWAHGWFVERTGIGTATACCGAPMKAQIDQGLFDLDHPDPTTPGDDTVYRSITGAPRVLDTRNEGGALPKGGQRTVHAHRAGLADGATHVAVTVTAVDTAGPGFLTAWPAGPLPTSSFVNYTTKGATVAGFTIVALSDFGTFEVAAPAAGCHVVVDVAGTFG
jgi:hypothetical protein